MKLFSLYRVELRRLFLSKRIWLTVVLCLCTPLLGYTVYKTSAEGVAANTYIANPVIAAGLAGAVIWALITILELDRKRHSGTEAMTDSAVSPTALAAARVMALSTISGMAAVLCALFYLPYTMVKMEYLFSLGFYCENYAILVLPTWWISILFAEGLYQIAGRVEAAGVLYAVLVYFNFSKISAYSFRMWISPWVITYSDGFKSLWPLRIEFYTKMIWLCFAVGLWLLSLLCLRKYQKSLLASFLLGLKKVHLPLLSVAFFLGGALLWKYQPFIDHGPMEWITAEDESWRDGTLELSGRISSAKHSIVTHPVLGTVSGRSEYSFIYSEEADTYFKLNPGYKVKSITYGDEAVEFRTVDDDMNGMRTTYFSLPAAWNQTLVIEYGGMPTQARSFTGMVRDTVDKEYISLDIRSLTPNMEYFFNLAGCIISIDFTIPDQLTPYLNFSLMTEFTDNQDGTRTWTAWNMGDSSRWAAVRDFIAGKYQTDTVTAADMEIDFTYGETYSAAVKEYDAAQAIADVFDYCTVHYGSCGFGGTNNRLLLQQRSAMRMSGFAHSGVSTFFETSLSPTTLSDPDKGASATEVFIHEIIHQWWGGLGLNIAEENSLWSAEGLTVYSTYRLVKEKYGELYANQYYVEEWKKHVEGQNRNFYNRHPEYLEMLPEDYRAGLRIANRGVNLYSRMPLMILKAEELVGGEENMDEILHQMFEDRYEYQQKYFTFQDFLDRCGLTEEDLRLE